MISRQHKLPKRISLPPFWVQGILVLIIILLVSSLQELQFQRSWSDIPESALRIFGQMFPPSLERLAPLSRSLLQTFEMAWLGNVLGLPISLILAFLAAKNTTPHKVTYQTVRGLLTFFRTTPPLVWAIFLITAVGLGPRAGTITLMISTIGFCGRFFAEAIEEVHPEPAEALIGLGASRIGTICSAIIPAASPSFINAALFNMEHTIRSSTVLGIVGAGGIGIELMVSIQTFHYDEAATIMLLVFAMVMAVEQVCAWIRSHCM